MNGNINDEEFNNIKFVNFSQEKAEEINSQSDSSSEYSSESD
jgi:hypothetical protein